MDKLPKDKFHESARRKFLALSLESTRKSYYPQLQQQLETTKTNEIRLQLLIDNLPAQISYISDKEAYALVNREFEKAVSLTRDQILGRTMKEILGEKIYTRVKPHINSALSGHSGRFEMSFTAEKKAEKWYEISYVAEKSSKKTNGFYVLTIDLTQKKKAEEERSKLENSLRHTQKIEAIGTLSGGIAHDFNNILSGIFGYSQLIDIHINDPEQIKTYNRKIIEGAQRAASLVQQILTFSRESEHNKQPLRLSLILKEALELIRSTLPANIEIKEDIRSRSIILADTTQIHQVIMNLCTNAYHAMADEGGILSITLEDVRITENDRLKNALLPPGKYLCLEISDTGHGIDREIREKIFDPYFTTKAMGKGTGLGLSIVSGIVKKHNGIIKLDTQADKGTRFHLYFPAVKTEPPCRESMETKKEKPFTATGRIMVVDDEQAILDTFSAILSRQGYEISAFNDGKFALDAFAEDPTRFDLIITDMTMPRLTGDKLAGEVLKIRKDIPILICTGYHENFSEADAVKAGITKFIQKPIEASKLSKIISEILAPRNDML